MLTVARAQISSRAIGRGLVRRVTYSHRSFTSTPQYLNEQTETIIKPPPKAKKSHGFRNFVLSGLIISGAFYGAGIWYSLKDDAFHDVFTEYVPFSERVITLIEEREFRRKFRDVDINKGAGPISSSDSLLKRIPEKLTNLKVKVRPGSSAEPKDVSTQPVSETKVDPSAVVSSAVIDSKPSSSPVIAPKKTTPSSAPVPVSAKDTTPSPLLPLIHVTTDIHPLVASSVDTLNQFIQSVNTSTYGDEIVDKISHELTRLSHHINALKQESEEQITKSLESQASKFASLGEARSNEIKEALTAQEQHWRSQFQEEQARIIQLYNQRLLTEIEATKNLVISHANNRLLAIHAEREKQFAKEIADRVEKEREGRLARIKELSEKVEELSYLTQATGSVLDESDNITKFHIAVGKLTSVLNSANEPVALGPYLEDIKNALPSDPLVESVLSNIPEDVYRDGVLTTAQLAARFRLLVPELRKASLLPPNAGVAGHIGSWLFSKLLAEKNGNPVGEDDESIFARAESALLEGRIVDAVAEVNSLSGWPKKLAGDWLAEGRKRSEIEFLAQTLADEGKLWALSDKK